MPETQSDLSLRQLADVEDIQFLEQAAAELGISPQQLAKELIERHIVARTRPKTMSGTVQPFRRAYKPAKAKPDEGLKSEDT
jgi:EAL domain-containing protein (putative c-di-GMP-specific phosphodiesterase class I)